jgi:flagellar biogenesis protein FliO
MARRAIRIDRLIAVMGIAVLLLGGVLLWLASRGQAPGAGREPVSERVLRQAREQLGSRAEVQLIEAGSGRVVCGYVAAEPRGVAVGFVSRPNRMLLSHDPLSTEFRALLAADCPNFPAGPIAAVNR